MGINNYNRKENPMKDHYHHETPVHKGGKDGPKVQINPWDHADIHGVRFIKGEDDWFHGGLFEFLDDDLVSSVKERMSEIRSNDIWWNNGVVESRSPEQPGPDFVKGRLPYSEESYRKISESHIGKRWFTDGENLIFAFECPEGFKPGKAPHSEETKQLMSQTHRGKKWWTDGETETFRFECPEGFRPGRKPGRKCPRG